MHEYVIYTKEMILNYFEVLFQLEVISIFFHYLGILFCLFSLVLFCFALKLHGVLFFTTLCGKVWNFI